MAKHEKNTDNVSENKVVTKYDLKMQRRAEEKEKAKKEERRNKILCALIVVAVFCFFISFPIRSWLSVNGSYVKIAGEDINRVEFDYNYNMVKNNFFATNSFYLSYMGMDIQGDLSKQMYSEHLSWKDYFEQLAVKNISQNKMLVKEANEKGFEYDVTEDYNAYLEEIREAAEAEGVSEEEYMVAAFGQYATIERLENIIKDSLHANAYYQKVGEDIYPTEEEVNARYEANKESYDSIDYRMEIFTAELPTEPTELADPVEETEDATESEQTTYTPSEAEVAKAMADAKALADEALETIMTEGAMSQNVLRTEMASVIRDWLFDESRKAGDTTIIEDEQMKEYYVLGFVDRYRDESPSADIRVIITDQGNGQAIFDEWKAGAATEESFGELADKYTIETESIEGGLYTGVLPTSGYPELDDWVSVAHEYGETKVIDLGDGVQYVMYYVGENRPSWKMNAESVILEEKINDYMSNLIADVEVVDKKGNLEYIEIEASVAAEESDAEVEAVPAE